MAGQCAEPPDLHPSGRRFEPCCAHQVGLIHTMGNESVVTLCDGAFAFCHGVGCVAKFAELAHGRAGHGVGVLVGVHLVRLVSGGLGRRDARLAWCGALPGQFGSHQRGERFGQLGSFYGPVAANYESSFLPGLLQTEDYARAVIRGVLPAATDEQVEDRVQARMERQPLLAKSPPLKFWVVVDEAALRRVVGGADVMKAQLEHLAEVVAAPNITLQVIPFGAGAHPGMPGQFILLDFADPMDTDLIYIDSMAGDLFLESEADISRYRSIFDNLVAVALSPKDSASLVVELALELKEQGG